MNRQERDPFDAFELFTIGVGVIALFLLSLAYFGVPSLAFLNQISRDFLQAIITNLVPTLLLFVLAYALFYRRIEKLRSERDNKQLVQTMADEVAKRVKSGSIESEFLEDIPESFRDELKLTREMWAVTVTANTLLNQYYSILEERIKQGMTLRVLMVDPDSASFEVAMSRGYIRTDLEQFRSISHGHLKYLKNLHQVAPNRVTVKVINNPLTFGAYLLDPSDAKGLLYIRHYPYKTPGGAKPCLVLTAKRSQRWFNHFQQEIQALWSDAKEWDFQ